MTLCLDRKLNEICSIKQCHKEKGIFVLQITHICTFILNKIIYEVDKTTNDLSDAISEDLQKRGMKFVGSTIIYSYLQAIGVIYSHEKECYLHKKM